MAKFKVGDRVRRAYNGFGTINVGDEGIVESCDGVNIKIKGHDWVFATYCFELVTPALTLTSGKFFRTASGKVTGRVSESNGSFEAIVDGKVRIFDKAGGAVGNGEDIVEEWVPKVGERVVCTQGTAVINEGQEYTVVAGTGAMLYGNTFFVDTGERGALDYNSDYFEPVATPLRIEAGRYYKTRDGRKVGPVVVAQGPGEPWPWKSHEGLVTYYYRESGFSCPGSLHDHRDADDLVALWEEPAVAPVAVAASNDNAAPAKDAENDLVISISVDAPHVHEALDEIIKKLKKIRKLQREVGIAA